MAAGVGVGRSPTTHPSAYATAVAPALAPPSRGFKFLIACLERPSVCDFKLYMLSARDAHTTAAREGQPAWWCGFWTAKWSGWKA